MIAFLQVLECWILCRWRGREVVDAADERRTSATNRIHLGFVELSTHSSFHLGNPTQYSMTQCSVGFQPGLHAFSENHHQDAESGLHVRNGGQNSGMRHFRLANGRWEHQPEGWAKRSHHPDGQNRHSIRHTRLRAIQQWIGSSRMPLVPPNTKTASDGGLNIEEQAAMHKIGHAIMAKKDTEEIDEALP